MTPNQNDLIINNLNIIHKALIDKGIKDEDSHAEAVLYVCENIGKYERNKGQFSTFIYLLINNMVEKKNQSKLYNKRKIHSEYMYSLDYKTNENFDLKEMIPDSHNNIDDFEIEESIRNIKNKLTENELIMFDLLLMGYKQKEVAERLNCTPQNISLIKKRIAKKI